MQFRVVTLNLQQDHKRWSDRHPLISAEIAGLRPDVIALNEVSVPLQTARLLRDTPIAATGIPYKLVQQTRVNGLSKVEGEALLTGFQSWKPAISIIRPATSSRWSPASS